MPPTGSGGGGLPPVQDPGSYSDLDDPLVLFGVRAAAAGPLALGMVFVDELLGDTPIFAASGPARGMRYGIRGLGWANWVTVIGGVAEDPTNWFPIVARAAVTGAASSFASAKAPMLAASALMITAPVSVPGVLLGLSAGLMAAAIVGGVGDGFGVW